MIKTKGRTQDNSGLDAVFHQKVFVSLGDILICLD